MLEKQWIKLILIQKHLTKGGWNSRGSIVDTCFENIGKIIYLIYKTTKCRKCSRKKLKLESVKIEEIDYNDFETKKAGANFFCAFRFSPYVLNLDVFCFYF